MNKYILQSLLLLFPRVTEYVIVDLVRRGHLSIPAVRQIPSLRNSLVYLSNHYSLSFSPSQSNIVNLPFRRKKAPPPNWERGYLPVASIKPLSERFLAVWAIENQDDHKEECVQWWCSKAVKVVFWMIVSSVTAETASDPSWKPSWHQMPNVFLLPPDMMLGMWMRMLSSVTLYCHVALIVMNAGSVFVFVLVALVRFVYAFP